MVEPSLARTTGGHQ